MKEKKKLLVFHTTIAPYRVDFFNSLATIYNMFICMDSKFVYGGLYKDIYKEYRFDYSRFNSKDGFWATFKFIARQIKDFHPDLILVSECGIVSILVVLYKYLSLKKYGIVSIIDDSYDQLIHNRHFTYRHKLAEKVLIPFFDQIINVDPKVSSYFKVKYGKGICFPIIRDEIIFRNNLRDALPVCDNYIKEYQLEGQRIILFVGRFVKLKNIPTLIRAFNEINHNFLNVKLVLVGSGDEELSIKSSVDNDNIIFTGALSGIYLMAWYVLSDIFVLPSTQEAFGAVTNEALMAGCNCLISERAGSSCLIKPGVNGYCFNPLDEGELKDRLVDLLHSSKGVPEIPFIRPNLMQISFEESFSNLINSIK